MKMLGNTQVFHCALLFLGRNFFMKAYQALPENYREIMSVDLKNNKKLALGISLLSFFIMLVMALIAIRPFLGSLLETEFDTGAYLLRLAVMLVSIFAYIVLHEAVHGIAMKFCGTKKVRFGVTLMYAFAGSDDYYDKKSYLFIALAPVVLWGLVLALICLLVPQSWFWVAYFIQILNISGASGDLYVTARFARLPDDILVRDWGVSMKVYSKE